VHIGSRSIAAQGSLVSRLQEMAEAFLLAKVLSLFFHAADRRNYQN
jgi:hypothetical protein